MVADLLSFERLSYIDVELLVSRDSILLLFHVHFVVYMVDHAFQNASQCSGRSVVNKTLSVLIVCHHHKWGSFRPRRSRPDSSAFVLDIGPELRDESRFRDSRKDRQN
jgi:hypothetical protein